MSDYYPRNSEVLAGWIARFNAYINAHYARLGLTAEDTNLVDVQRLDWETKYSALVAAELAVKGKRDMKRGADDALEALIRPMVQRIQTAPGTTDEDRAAMEITVRGASTAGIEIPVEEKPTAHINFSSTLEHNLTIRVKTSGGEKRAKPAGVIGTEIYRKLGTAPTGPSETEFVTMTTKSQIKLFYPDTDGGKKAHYMMRYVARDGSKGPWSEVESATIAA